VYDVLLITEAIMRSGGGGGVGLGLAVLSAATFGTAGSFAAALLAAGWSPGAAVCARVSIAALALTIPALLQMRGRWRLLRHSAPTALAYGLVAVGGAQLCYFNAVAHLSVGVALLLEYSGTLLVVGWMWLRRGQRPRRLTMLGAALAIVGLVLVLDLTGSQRVDLVGVLWGLGAAVGLATYFVISSNTEESLPPIAMAWAGLAIGAPALLLAGLVGIVPLHATTSDAVLADHAVSWAVPILGLALVAAAFAYCAGIAAARRLGARLASFVGLAEVLFAVLFAWALLDQRPALLQAIGGVVVLAGIAVVRLDEREPASAVTFEPDVAPVAA
jgi:drug/metabolite transporter (DMT)-like permease